MAALLHNVSLLQHINCVSVHDGGEAVGDQDRDLLPPGRHLPDRAGNFFLGEGVEGGRGRTRGPHKGQGIAGGGFEPNFV